MAQNMDNVSISGSGSGSDTEVTTSSRCMEYVKAARVGLPSQKITLQDDSLTQTMGFHIARALP